MDRLVNYIFIILLIILFILEGRSDDHIRILIALLLAFSISFPAFLFNWLTLDGFVAAIIIGVVTLGLGGWVLGLLVVLFFVSSSLITGRYFTGRLERPYLDIEKGFVKTRRNGLQLWANGFWFTLFAVLWFLTQQELYLILAAASIAAVTADTWATEIGLLKSGKTVRITNFERVEPGVDGGISFHGTAAGLLGALLIGVSFIVLKMDFSLVHFLAVTVSGFSGCIADSYLGAIYQRKNSRIRRIKWLKRILRSDEDENNAVNWISSGFGALAALFIIQLI